MKRDICPRVFEVKYLVIAQNYMEKQQERHYHEG